MSTPNVDLMSKSFYEESSTHTEQLTPGVLRSFPGCEHHSDEEAEDVITTLEQLANILYDIYLEQNQVSGNKI